MFTELVKRQMLDADGSADGSGVADRSDATVDWLLPRHARQLSDAQLAASKDDEAKVFAPQAKYTAMISLLITALIAHFMLCDAMFKDGQLVWHLVAMHYVVPIMALLDWLLFDEKGKMIVWGPFAWLSLAAAYLVVVMIGAGPLGLDLGGGTTAGITRYPYTFLDPAISGVGGVALFIAAMIVAFIVIGYLIFAIDKILGRIANRK